MRGSRSVSKSPESTSWWRSAEWEYGVCIWPQQALSTSHSVNTASVLTVLDEILWIFSFDYGPQHGCTNLCVCAPTPQYLCLHLSTRLTHCCSVAFHSALIKLATFTWRQLSISRPLTNTPALPLFLLFPSAMLRPVFKFNSKSSSPSHERHINYVFVCLFVVSV